MLLNKIGVLDKGFVAILDTSCNGKILQGIQDEYFKSNVNMKLLNLASATLVIKCPLYIQLNLSQHGLNVVSTPSDNIEAYIPDLSMIDGKTLEDRSRVRDYISNTTEALILNQKGLPMDGCSAFTAQLLSPISIYSEIIVSGKLTLWLEYLRQKKLPREVELYQKEIFNLLSIEWKNLGAML